jgi:DNA-binding LytR/AlgR family response regulator
MGVHLRRYVKKGKEEPSSDIQPPVLSDQYRVRSTAVTLIPAITENSRVHDLPLFVKQGRSYHRVNARDILAVEADGCYVKLCGREGEHVLHNSLNAVMSHLPVNMFCMVNRKQAVNILMLQSVGSHEVEVDGRTFELSAKFRPRLLDMLPIVRHR